MSVEPRDLLREARQIAERVDEETARRNAAARAYYAAFHGAQRYHNQLPRPGRSKAAVGEHENLIHQLMHPDAKLPDEKQKQSYTVGHLLLQLRPSRIRADYDLNSSFTISDMTDAVEMSAQILNITDPK